MYWNWSSAEKTEEERGLRFNNQCGYNHKSKLLLEIKHKKSLSNGRTERIPWTGKANETLTTSAFLASPANGTYTLSFNATNVSSLNLGAKTYQPSITIYYD